MSGDSILNTTALLVSLRFFPKPNAEPYEATRDRKPPVAALGCQNNRQASAVTTRGEQTARSLWKRNAKLTMHRWRLVGKDLALLGLVVSLHPVLQLHRELLYDLVGYGQLDQKHAHAQHELVEIFVQLFVLFLSCAATTNQYIMDDRNPQTVTEMRQRLDRFHTRLLEESICHCKTGE